MRSLEDPSLSRQSARPSLASCSPSAGPSVGRRPTSEPALAQPVPLALQLARAQCNGLSCNPRRAHPNLRQLARAIPVEWSAGRRATEESSMSRSQAKMIRLMWLTSSARRAGAWHPLGRNFASRGDRAQSQRRF
eukprot:5703126-Alexandrium_andersonii.AAC.1